MSRRFVKALVALPAICLLVACGLQMTAEERVDLARKMLTEGDSATAAIHLRNVLQADPANVDARVMLAEATFAAGDFDSSAKEYLRALDLGADIEAFRVPLVEALVRAGGLQDALRFTDPESTGPDAELSYWRALALARLGRADEGRDILEGLQSTPGFEGRAGVALARLALGARDPGRALELLAPVESTMSTDAEFWEVRAFAAVQAGNIDLAVESFDKALERLPAERGRHRFVLLAGKIEALLVDGRLDDARRIATGLHQQAERDPTVNYLMSRVELQSGNAGQALAHAQAVLAADPESSVGNMMAGASSLTLGQTVQAERYLERAIARDPNNLPARKLLAQTRLGLQSPERALEAISPVLGDAADPDAAALAGVASIRAGEPDMAIEIFKRQLELSPDNDEFRAMLAVSLITAGRTEEALAELSRIEAGSGILRRRADMIGIAAHLQGGDLLAARSLAGKVAAEDGDNAPLLTTLGALFHGAEQLDEAAAWYEEALAVSPGHVPAAYNLGRLAAATGRLDRSAALFEGIVAKDPGHSPALTALAQIDWARGDRAGAVARLERARQADPADGGSRFVLSQYLVNLGRAAEAVAVAREAVDIAPNSAPAVNTLGVALLESRQPREALEKFGRAHEINPLEARYLLNSARAHSALGQMDLARDQLVKALALEPDNAVMLAALVEVEMRSGRPEGAAQALARLERASGRGDPRVILMRGEVLLAQEHFPEAALAFEEARRLGMGGRAAVGIFEARRRGGLPDPTAPLHDWLRESPDDIPARAVLADHHLVRNDHAAAIREYRVLVESVPDGPLFLNNLAWLLGEAGEPGALDLARRAHESAPDDPMIMDTYGWILYQNGDRARALELLAEASRRAPQAGDIRYRYAVVLGETGDANAALREVRAVLADPGAANYHELAQKLLARLEREGG